MRMFKIFLMTILFLVYARSQTNFNPSKLRNDISRNLIELAPIIVSKESQHKQPAQTHQNNNSEITDNRNDIHEQEHEDEGHHYHSPSDPQFWENVALATFLTIVGAFCSGMTVGLLSISTMELQMMTMKKNEREVKMAKMILSVVTDHHLFLVTLLVANAMALESLPLVVHTLMPDWAAILFSTFIVLIVAEIVPQAYCTGEKKIILAYYASPIILVMIKIFWIIVYPIAKGLDYMLGVHHHQRIQHKDFATFLNEDTFLKNTQKLLLNSTLQLRTERVQSIMIRSSDLFMLEEKQYITEQIARQIQSKDFSYIMVYKEKRNKVTGFIKVKQFAIKYLKESKRQFRADQIMKPNSNMLTVYSDTNLLEMLMLFQAKSTRIALICNLKRKIDPKIQSIMYSKSDMIYSNSAKDVEVLGFVFLYQIFDQMAKLKERIERQSSVNSKYRSEVVDRQMTTLRQPLINH